MKVRPTSSPDGTAVKPDPPPTGDGRTMTGGDTVASPGFFFFFFLGGGGGQVARYPLPCPDNKMIA